MMIATNNSNSESHGDLLTFAITVKLRKFFSKEFIATESTSCRCLFSSEYSLITKWNNIFETKFKSIQDHWSSIIELTILFIYQVPSFDFSILKASTIKLSSNLAPANRQPEKK